METALHIDNLSVYYGDEVALSKVCLNVAHGEMLGIIGPNGGGKSTLLKAILGLVEPTSGSVRIYGKEPGQNHAAVGFVPQFAVMDRRFPISVFEVVLTGRLKPGLSFSGNTPKRTKRSPLRS